MSIEKWPELRIVGGAPPEKKEEVRKKLHDALFYHFESLSPEEQAKVEKFEYKKSEKENNLIDFANQETNKLRRDAGVEPYDIPYENYHLLPSEIYKEMGGRLGCYGATRFSKQEILIDAELFSLDPVILGSVFMHETLHLKGYQSVEAEAKDGEARNTFFRLGIMAQGAQGSHPHRHFIGLHEAIVAAQEKKSFQKMFNSPLFEKEKEWWISNEAKEKKEKMVQDEKIPESEILWINKDGQVTMFGYFQPRQVLDYICSEIQKENQGRYQNQDEVFSEFLKAHFTGQLSPIARLIEKTFGDGSFRALSSMSEEDESAILHMELLKKARARKLKKEKT